MPRISRWCKKCYKHMESVYRRVSLPNKKSKWERLECVFYCPKCDILNIFPVKNALIGGKLDELIIVPHTPNQVKGSNPPAPEDPDLEKRIEAKRKRIHEGMKKRKSTDPLDDLPKFKARGKFKPP